jgi:alkylation response protein AidB-like acyl-CoA dehydrogenase
LIGLRRASLALHVYDTRRTEGPRLNFDFSEEQKMLQKTVRDFLAEHAPLERVRTIFEGDEPTDRDLWKAAGEMGWLGAAMPEDLGGAGFGYLELAAIAEELGRALAPIPVSSSIYLASEAILCAGSSDQQERYLPDLASGARIGTFALAEPGRDAPGQVETRFEGGRLRGRKVPVPDGDIADLAVVVAREEGGAPCLTLVDLDAPGVKRRPLRSIDPSRSQALIEFHDAHAERLEHSGDVDVAGVLDRACVLLAFEQLGGAQACLDTAREYTLGRFAFGRAIGSFQAMKHRMADMFTAVELARSNCYFGAWALSSDSDELPVAACSARISATQAYRFCAEENLHLHGGLGFTWEYDCHLYLRRAKLLELSLGPVGLWKRRLIERLEPQAAGREGL